MNPLILQMMGQYVDPYLSFRGVDTSGLSMLQNKDATTSPIPQATGQQVAPPVAANIVAGEHDPLPGPTLARGMHKPGGFSTGNILQALLGSNFGQK